MDSVPPGPEARNGVTAGLAERAGRGKLQRLNRFEGTMGAWQTVIRLFLVGAVGVAADAGRADDVQDLARCRNTQHVDAKIVICSGFLKNPQLSAERKKQFASIVSDALLERALDSVSGKTKPGDDVFRKALSDVDEAAALVPNAWRPLMNRGIILRLRAGDLQDANETEQAGRMAAEALKSLEAAARIETTTSRIWYELAYVEHTFLGKTDEAFTHCARALEVDKDYSFAHFLMGRIQIALKKDEEALASFQRAFDLNWTNAGFREQLVKAAIDQAALFQRSAKREEAAKTIYDLSEAVRGSKFTAWEAYVISRAAADVNRMAIALEYIEQAIARFEDGSLAVGKDHLMKLKNNVIVFYNIEVDWIRYLREIQRDGTGVNWLGEPYDLYFESRISSTND